MNVEVKGKDGEIIRFIDGYCWGIARDGRTISCGAEASAKAAITNPKLKSFNPEIDEIIELEIELRKEQEDGTRNPKLRQSIITRRYERGRIMRSVKPQGGYTKKSPSGKRLPIYKSNDKG